MRWNGPSHHRRTGAHRTLPQAAACTQCVRMCMHSRIRSSICMPARPPSSLKLSLCMQASKRAFVCKCVHVSECMCIGAYV